MLTRTGPRGSRRAGRGPRRPPRSALPPGRWLARPPPRRRRWPRGLAAARRAATPCRKAAAVAASGGVRPWASSAPARPESTSPDPAVASQGVPVELTRSGWAQGESGGEQITVVEPLSRTVTPRDRAASRAWVSRWASMSARSAPVSRDSSPACGVISVGADLDSRSRCSARIVSPSASTRTGTSVRSTAASSSAESSPVPIPGPATQAWTRPAKPGSPPPWCPASGCRPLRMTREARAAAG